MKTRQRRAKMLTGISLLAIIPFLILCTFVYPVNDDFTFGLRHIQKNVFQVSSDIYLYWSGRYFATLISALNPFAVSDNPIPLFRIYSAVAIVLTTIVMTLSPAICCRRQLTRCQSAGFGGGIFAHLPDSAAKRFAGVLLVLIMHSLHNSFASLYHAGGLNDCRQQSVLFHSLHACTDRAGR